MPEEYYSYCEVEDQDGTFYIFNSLDRSGYTVYFKIDEYTEYVDEYPLLLQKGYAFGFLKTPFNNKRKTKDPVVFETIYKIVLDFLEQQGPDTVLLYHCDSKDGRHSCRNRLFNSWANSTYERKNFIKHSVEVIIGSETKDKKSFYLGFLTLSDNPLIDSVKEEFETFSVNLITGKD